MKLPLLISFLMFTSIRLYGQEYSGDFNELPDLTLKHALEMKTYDKDSSAGAVLLYDLATVDVVPVGTKLSYLRRLKILKKSEYNNWANVKIYVQKLGFTKIVGFTSNLENGQIVKTEIGESQIFKTSYNKEWDEYAFTMPNVKEGTVIEYAWKTVLDFYTLPDWEFQHSIPVLWSQYSLDNPIVSFRSDITGPLKVNYEPAKGRKPHRWTVANVPAFKKEPLMPNDDLFRSKLNLWPHSDSWNEVAEQLWANQHFRLVVTGQDILLPIAKDVGGGLTVAPRNRIKNLVEYLKSNVPWNGTCDYLSDEPEVVFKRKKGTSGDINIILASLLAKAGITVNSVLISTRDNGHYHEKVPSRQQFNYVICQAIIGTDTLYVDATEPDLRYDALPVRALNDRGLVVTKEGAYWVNIKTQFKKKVTVDADFTLQKSGELQGKLTITRDGYAAHTSRQGYLADKENFYRTSINGAWQVNEKHFENEKEYDQPIIET